jgi:hypothetical protein
MTNKKSKNNGNSKSNSKRGFPSGMTNKKGKSKSKDNSKCNRRFPSGMTKVKTVEPLCLSFPQGICV